jgi:hypothetical protein
VRYINFNNNNNNIHLRLSKIPQDILCVRTPVWHRPCYSSTTNKTFIQHAKDRMQQYMSADKCKSRKQGQKGKEQTLVTTVHSNYQHQLHLQDLARLLSIQVAVSSVKKVENNHFLRLQLTKQERHCGVH